MTILYAGEPGKAEAWLSAIQALDPAILFRTWPDWGDPDDIDCIIVSGHIPGDISIFRNAKAIQSTSSTPPPASSLCTPRVMPW